MRQSISAGQCWKDRVLLRVDSAVWVLGALLLLTVPLNWLLAAFAAAAFHETCHALAVKAVGGKVWGLKLGIGGAEMATSPLSHREELLCALAGPVGSLSLLLLCRQFPRLALCGACQGTFNLLPLFPLDGGRILRCMAPKWSGFVGKYGGVFLMTLAVFGAIFRKTGWLPVVLAAIVMAKGKNPCKSGRFGVQ